MSCTDQIAAHAASQALRHNEDQWRELFTQGSDAIFVADLDGRYTDVNEAGCQLLGYRRDELVGKTIVDLIDARDVARLAQSKARLLDGGVLVSEWALRHRDGHFVPVEVRARILSDGRWVGFIRDVIAHKRALDAMQDAAAGLERRVAQRTEQLQRLVADLEMTEIRERRQIARDLHDDLSQTLAAVNIRLAALRDHACAEVRHTVGSVDLLLDSAHRAIRSLAARLTPALLDELGLVPALSWLGDEIERQFGLRVQVDDDGEAKPLSQEARSIVYRATRELLINAAKHAGIDHVRVECLRDGEQVRVQVSDRGVGFDLARLLAANAAASATTAAAAASDRRGFGLVSLHERMAFIGGSARVISRPGHGTRVVLRAPLSPVCAAADPVPGEAAATGVAASGTAAPAAAAPPARAMKRSLHDLQDLVDAMTAHVAVIDSSGEIQVVNRAWREFATRSGDPDLRHCGPGVNYLAVCQRGAPSDASAQRVSQGLAEVLNGRRAGFTLAYACHAPDQQRWFLMQATAMAGGDCLVSHFNLTHWLDPAYLRATLDDAT